MAVPGGLLGFPRGAGCLVPEQWGVHPGGILVPKATPGHCNVVAVGTPQSRLLRLTSALLPAPCIWCCASA